MLRSQMAEEVFQERLDAQGDSGEHRHRRGEVHQTGAVSAIEIDARLSVRR
jgi:hypothetical protein